MRERQDTPRNLECLPVFRTVECAVSALDVTESPQATTGSDLPPSGEARFCRIDDAAKGIEWHIAELFRQRLTNRKSRLEIELMRKQDPRDSLLPKRKPRARAKP